MDDALWNDLSARMRFLKLLLMDSGRDSVGVMVVILLLTRNVASILKVESTVDHKVSGQIVSLSSSKQVTPNLSTKRLEMQLILAAESNKHLAYSFPSFASTFTKAVGSKVMEF